MLQKLHIYLVSDSSAETVTHLSRAVMAQFTNFQVIEHLWPLAKSLGQIDALMKQVQREPGIVIYTLVLREMEDYLRVQCAMLAVPCINPMEEVMREIEEYTHAEPSRRRPGKSSVLDPAYFKRIDCINYALLHDDGQSFADFSDADIVLLGVSRTSKTPTAFYLALRGYKVANLPIIEGIAMENLNKLEKPLLVGLTIDAEYLVKVRQNRFVQFHDPKAGDPQKVVENYLSATAAREELRYARSIFKHYNIPVIDVTNIAVEEIAAAVLNILFTSRGDR